MFEERDGFPLLMTRPTCYGRSRHAFRREDGVGGKETSTELLNNNGIESTPAISLYNGDLNLTF